LEGNFLPKGNIGLWKDRNKEMQCGRKSEGNFVIWMESGNTDFHELPTEIFLFFSSASILKEISF
jgi:hypothetical protein